MRVADLTDAQIEVEVERHRGFKAGILKHLGQISRDQHGVRVALRQELGKVQIVIQNLRTEYIRRNEEREIARVFAEIYGQQPTGDQIKAAMIEQGRAVA
jgi:hypothetical protein